MKSRIRSSGRLAGGGSSRALVDGGGGGDELLHELYSNYDHYLAFKIN